VLLRPDIEAVLAGPHKVAPNEAFFRLLVAVHQLDNLAIQWCGGKIGMCLCCCHSCSRHQPSCNFPTAFVTLFEHPAQAAILISVVAHLPQYGPVCVKILFFSLLDFQVLSGLAHDHVTATSIQIRHNHLAVPLPDKVCTPEAALLDGLWVCSSRKGETHFGAKAQLRRCTYDLWAEYMQVEVRPLLGQLAGQCCCLWLRTG